MALGGKKRRTTVMLPSRLAEVIRREATGPRTSAAKVILHAHLSHQETLRGCYDTPENRERVRLGLEPEIDRSLYDPDEDARQVSLYLHYDANKQLAEAASALGLSRRRYIAELVSLEFGHRKEKSGMTGRTGAPRSELPAEKSKGDAE